MVLIFDLNIGVSDSRLQYVVRVLQKLINLLPVYSPGSDSNVSTVEHALADNL